jgi:hypothetical protein
MAAPAAWSTAASWRLAKVVVLTMKSTGTPLGALRVLLPVLAGHPPFSFHIFGGLRTAITAAQANQEDRRPARRRVYGVISRYPVEAMPIARIGNLLNPRIRRRTIRALGLVILSPVAWACSSSEDTTAPSGSPSTTSTGTTGAGATASTGTSAGTGSTASTTSGVGGGAGAGTSTGSGGGGTGGSGGAGGSGVGSGMSCGRPTVPVASSMISTFDGPAEPLASVAVSPAGKWAVDTDGTGTASLKVEDTSDPVQRMAAHFTGAGHTSWGAAMQTNLSGETMPTGVDAGAYSGISFDLRTGSANMATSLVVKFENEDAIPACNLCNDMLAGKDCHAGYVITHAIMAGPGWTTVTIPFSMFDASSYGNHALAVVDRKQIISLAVAVYLRALPFDLWIDNVRFSK